MKYYDRVLETTTTTGSGNLTLAGATTGYKSFYDTVGTSGYCSYGIVDDTNNAWEIGLGQIQGTGNVLYRQSILASSNSNSLVNFSAGTKNVFLNAGAEFANKQEHINLIWNGNFDIWQAGTSFTSPSNGQAIADSWYYSKNNTATHDVSRSTDVPTVAQSNCFSNYSVLVDCTATDASIAAGDYAGLYCRIEGFDWQPFAQRTITLSFWVKATKTGIYCISLRNSGYDRSYVAEYTINASDVWEKKIITISASPSGGTWDYTNGMGLDIFFALAAGSSFYTTKDAWQTGSYLITSSQVNALDSTSNNFRLAQVKIEPGRIATTFIPQSFDKLLRKAQRYYETTYAHGVTVPTAGGTEPTAFMRTLVPSNTVANGQSSNRINFKVSKRTTPTVTVYPYNTPTNTGRVSDSTPTDEAANTGTVLLISDAGFSIYNNSGASYTTTLLGIIWAWQADARL
jgi:hypothetical protein